MKKILLPLTALLATTASAAPKISAQSIIVNPVQPNLSVRVWTDRDASGDQTPNYYVNDRIRLYTSVSQDAYVYLFNVDPNGQVDLILPNRYAGGGNFLRANTVKAFPSSGDQFTFDIAAPYGINKVLALASQTQLNLDQIATFKSQQTTGFATSKVQGQQNLAQALSIVVNPIPQNSWVSDTAFYNVAGGVSQTPVTPVPAQPVVTYPTPDWNQSNRWSYNFSNSGTSLGNVYKYYVNQLARQGYRLVSSEQRGNRIDARFEKSGGDAKLSVRQRGDRFDIEVERRS